MEIVLFGSDLGVAEAAAEFGAIHIPNLAVNSYGTPLVSDAFSHACAISSRTFLMYSNGDMLYDRSLLTSVNHLQNLDAFLLSGRRWDIDVNTNLVDATDATWDCIFSKRAIDGSLHGPAGMDYFIFPRQLELSLPSFAVGRVGWDSWLVWKCRVAGIPVVDASSSITALHQNHSYGGLKLGYQHARGPERDLNIQAAGGLSHLLTLREASHHLVNGTLRSPPWPGRFFALLGPTRPYQKLLALKRALA